MGQGKENILDEFLSFSVTLQTEALHVLRQPDQGRLKETAMFLALLHEVCRTKPQLRVGRTETLVALLHARRDIGRLAHLLCTREVAIKDFEDQYAQPIGIDRC